MKTLIVVPLACVALVAGCASSDKVRQVESTSETNQKLLREGYRKGKLTFTLVGKKLGGEFSLVRMRGRNAENKAWLLIT